MFVSHLECSRCNKTYDSEKVHQLCECGGPLLVHYNLEKVVTAFKKDDLLHRPPNLWRYRELLPVRDPKNIVCLGEGMTPIVKMNNVGKDYGMSELFLKDEGIIPTGTFKARGAAVGVSRARELGIKVLAMPTNGNAGGAWAAYCASVGIEIAIVMPNASPSINKKECSVLGAHLYLVNGLISDAGKIVSRAVAKRGWFDASTLKEPYRIEGKKTMGLEIAEQFNWDVPDVILYPTGGGVGLIGIYKGLRELQEMGWIGEKMPRLVSVQAEGCCPIVKAWREGKKESDFFENSKTVAFGINVPKALGDFIVLEAIYATKGCAVSVTDEEILEAEHLVARREGMFICPEGASTVAAVKKLKEQGWIKPNEKVLALNTGTGLKYPETVEVNAPILQPDDNIPDTKGV